MAKYEFKDAFMILKAIECKCKDLYDSKSDIIVRQLQNIPDRKYRCKYGLFNLKTNAQKTIKEYTKEEKAEFDKLQMQIDKLKEKQNKLGTTKVVKEAFDSLVCNKNAVAENEATELLKDLIATIGNATMIKASKSKIKVAKK